jgi:hypothetical protein
MAKNNLYGAMGCGVGAAPRGPESIQSLMERHACLICPRCGRTLSMYTRQVEVRGAVMVQSMWGEPARRLPAVVEEHVVLKCKGCQWWADVDERAAEERGAKQKRRRRD